MVLIYIMELPLGICIKKRGRRLGFSLCSSYLFHYNNYDCSIYVMLKWGDFDSCFLAWLSRNHSLDQVFDSWDKILQYRSASESTIRNSLRKHSHLCKFTMLWWWWCENFHFCNCLNITAPQISDDFLILLCATQPGSPV